MMSDLSFVPNGLGGFDIIRHAGIRLKKCYCGYLKRIRDEWVVKIENLSMTPDDLRWIAEKLEKLQFAEYVEPRLQPIKAIRFSEVPVDARFKMNAFGGNLVTFHKIDERTARTQKLNSPGFVDLKLNPELNQDDCFLLE